MYLDTAYIAKFYLNETDSKRVRTLVRDADVIFSSMWAFAEFHAVLHRQVREEALTVADARSLAALFAKHIEGGLWNLVPVTEALLRRTSALILAAPHDVSLRTGEAVHLATARQIGEVEVWTNDRQMLASASHFGMTGRSV